VRALPLPESKVLDFTHFDKLWKKARAEAGLLQEVWEEGMNRWQKVKANKNFHLHDLRHTAASYAIMGSKDPDAAQHFLRLKTQSLMARYAHGRKAAKPPTSAAAPDRLAGPDRVPVARSCPPGRPDAGLTAPGGPNSPADYHT